MEWQPIETAPKDGADVLVFYQAAGVAFAHIAYWDDGTETDPDDVGWWFYRSSLGREMLEGYFTPTHWMPLPAPPELPQLGHTP